MSLDKTYRPKNFDEFIGNEDTVKKLKAIFNRKEKIPSALLFVGPSGTGKTTLARIVSNHLLNSQDIKEINLGNTGGVDEAREIIKSVQFKSLRGKWKIIILDEIQESSSKFQGTMLKTLEEPPSGVLFILCTTNPEKLLKTVKTRCTPFTVSKLENKEIEIVINNVLKNENKEINKKTLLKLISKADGSPRQALVLLDSIIDLEQSEMFSALDSFSDEEKAEKLAQNIYKSDWNAVKEELLLIKSNDEIESLRHGILGYLNSGLLKWNKKVKDEIMIFKMDCFKDNFFHSGKSGFSIACYKACNHNKYGRLITDILGD